MSELPDDLLEEIFFLLPATSVIRLRSTCKRWNRLLKDRVFTKNHLDKAPEKFQSLMLKASGVCLMHVDIGRFPHVMIKREATLTERDQIKIMQVSHCDGLLLCYTNTSMLVLWNPCTGQTRWIQPRDSYETCCTYALGSYQDKKSNCNNSYKILRHRWGHVSNPSNPLNYVFNKEFEIYVINSNSNSWRTIDVTIDKLECLNCGVSLKGKTYWIGNKTESDTYTCIVSFDYTAERFERLCLLPYQYDRYETLSLSVVREEKLVLLLQHDFDERTEIWVTNKISETKEVSWERVLAFDFHPLFISWEGGSFVVDEEKKVVVFISHDIVYIVGEDNDVRKVDLEISSPPLLFNYVPSLIRLDQQGIRGKRKRGE